MKVIVVGGGIGGLSLALSLHQAGIAVRVYEAVDDPIPIGVGINLQPTAVRELTELGLGDALAQIAIAPQRLSYFNKLGQLIWSEARGLSAGYKWPQYSIHRGRLQSLLLHAARERIGEDNVRSGLRLASFEQSRNRVLATFRHRASAGLVQDDADILVGADGIHSAVRRHLYSQEGEPQFAGQVLWRAAVETEPFLDGRTIIIAGHFNQRVIAYPIAPGRNQGRLVTNWICQLRVEDHPRPREDWNRKVRHQRVLAAFDGWRFGWFDLPELIRRSPKIYEFPLVDRDPLPAWTFGRVTLLGDAAHPMQPIGAQAGTQAIIDARLLTAALLTAIDPLDALERYDAERRPAMNEIALRIRRLGPEAALQIVEERAPNGFERSDDVISERDIKAIVASFTAAAGLDVENVNGRPSFVPRQRAG
jgi:5-methylphenazine-1-carboxylate 1-monooxygenase